MTKNTRKYLLLSALLGGVLLPSACSLVTETREITAERIARPAFMVERKTELNGMSFMLWERMHERYQPANVYIEGDGQAAYLNRDTSEDPTPENPVALNLASRDLAENVAYIGRPCQFRESPDHEACDPKFWSERRFSPEVLASYNAMLDQIKGLYSITEFNLIGYDGGANIAAALAAQRKDVASLRTVAGNLNPEVVYAAKGQVMAPDSILAPAIAPALTSVPQHHFVGAGDEIIPPTVYHAFRQKMGPSECVHYTLVQDADHERGWVEKWPELLKATTECPPPAYQPTTPLPPVPPHLEKP